MVFLFRPLFILGLLILPSATQAAQPLIYKSGDTDLRIRNQAAFLLDNGHLDKNLPYETARVDLNGDGISETIFRQTPTGCAVRAECPHIIAGTSPEKAPVLIATLEARKIGIAGEKAYGVHSLFVYNRQSDDFAYEIFVWNPRKPAYEPK